MEKAAVIRCKRIKGIGICFVLIFFLGFLLICPTAGAQDTTTTTTETSTTTSDTTTTTEADTTTTTEADTTTTTEADTTTTTETEADTTTTTEADTTTTTEADTTTTTAEDTTTTTTGGETTTTGESTSTTQGDETTTTTAPTTTTTTTTLPPIVITTTSTTLGISTTTTTTSTTLYTPVTTTTIPPSPYGPGEIPETLTLATFNLNGFDPSADSAAVNLLADILRRFSIIALQEIDPAAETMAAELERLMDANGNDYSQVMTHAYGSEARKRRYAFFYQTDSVSVVPDPYIFSDTEDLFTHEPLVMRFTSVRGDLDLTVINIHVDPAAGLSEISALSAVVNDARNRFPEAGHFLIVGSLTADCGYFSPANATGPLKGPAYHWLVSNHAADTDAGCTYDVIISTTLEDYTYMKEVFDWDERLEIAPELADAIGDDPLLWASFYTGHDDPANPVVTPPMTDTVDGGDDDEDWYECFIGALFR